MSTETKESLKMIRVAEAAKMADVSEDMVMRWINGGHLQVFVPPGHKVGDGQRGPKSIRIFLADWMAFLAANTGVPLANEEAKPRARAAATFEAVGSDGIKRLGRRRSSRP